jgi:thioredoxin-like negative regulator of GroEL
MESRYPVRNRNQQARIVEATATEARPESRPKLVFVYSETCGHSRRVEAFLAQVLQRRHNHDTFHLVRVSAEKQPKLVEQLGVAEVPTLLIIDKRKIEARVERPRGRVQIQTALGRWLK